VTTEAGRTDATILVLAKEPAPGRAKTRLTPPCTPEQAATIAEAALTQTLESVLAVRDVRRVLVLDGEVGPWLPEGFDVLPQRRGDLADRLRGAFASSTGPTVLVGMDTPQITAARLRATVDALLTPDVDAVLGLTLDGGWWTIGVRNPHQDLFAGIPTSTDSTGRRQWERLHALGLRSEQVPAAVDVDDFSAARLVADLVPGSRFAGAVDEVTASLANAGWAT